MMTRDGTDHSRTSLAYLDALRRPPTQQDKFPLAEGLLALRVADLPAA